MIFLIGTGGLPFLIARGSVTAPNWLKLLKITGLVMPINLTIKLSMFRISNLEPVPYPQGRRKPSQSKTTQTRSRMMLSLASCHPYRSALTSQTVLKCARGSLQVHGNASIESWPKGPTVRIAPKDETKFIWAWVEIPIWQVVSPKPTTTQFIFTFHQAMHQNPTVSKSVAKLSWNTSGYSSSLHSFQRKSKLAWPNVRKRTELPPKPSPSLPFFWYSPHLSTLPWMCLTNGGDHGGKNPQIIQSSWMTMT